MKRLILAATILLLQFNTLSAKELFNNGWQFAKCDLIEDAQWESVQLPHTANLEPLVVNDQWQGICWYKKSFAIESYDPNKIYLLEFEAAMNHTSIWINDKAAKVAEGGYLPIVLDITPFITKGENTITLRLDNNDNERTGPKPLKILDFNMYGGVYRNAWLITKNKCHITHPILADRTASGGVFVTFPKVSQEKSQIKIATHIANEKTTPQDLKLTYKIYDTEQNILSQSRSKEISLEGYDNRQMCEVVTLPDAKLWSPAEPNLHRLEVELWADDELIDTESVKFGIREFTITDNQLYINGERSYLRGVNRHQEYPYIGYALSDNAQYRDAKKIKDGGFDYIRLSHYPHSTAFMEACDELGLVVTDAILGWQFYRESYDFKSSCVEATRNLIRRDRNHACVLSWEASLNETKMPESFMKELHKAVHEEYPGPNTYSTGWLPQVYDIYLQARQHRIGHPEEVTFEKPYMVSEYGDWEYYSTNAGLNQHNYSQEKRIEMSSRQLRSDGEVRLLQQAYNVQEAHNDNMSIPATGDSYWVMYDYNRGYHNELEASGVMDIFRLPKFAYYFYKSQRSGEPMVEIASYWSESSPTDLRIFSNCEEVALYLNGKLVARQNPDQSVNTTNLNHPPFTFEMGEFTRGELKAVGYIAGKEAARSSVRSAGAPKALKCWIDESGKAPEAGCQDAIFLYVAAVDKQGTICTDFTEEITISVDGKCTILNTDGVITEAGIATALLRIGDQKGVATISARSAKLRGGVKFEIQ